MTRFQQRRATASVWTTKNPVLLKGELGIEETEGLAADKIKVGDGVSTWSQLNYIGGGVGEVDPEDLAAAVGAAVADLEPGTIGAATVAQIEDAVAPKVDASDLAVVATSGAYTDLSGRPTIPSSAADVGAATVAQAQGLVDTAVSQLLGGAPAAALDTIAELATELADQDSAVAALTSGLAARVPTTRTVAGKALTSDVTLVKGDVGLGNVANTAPADLPVSTAQASADAAVLASATSLVDGLPELATGAGLQASTAGGVTTLSTTLGASTVMARLATGDVVAATPAEMRTLVDVDSKFESAVRVGLAGPVSSRVTATQQLTVSSTTFQNVTNMVVALQASRTYWIRAYVSYIAPAAADIKFAWTVPTGATGMWTPGGLATTTSGIEGSILRAPATFESSGSRPSGGSGSEVVAVLEGIILTTTAGNLQLQAAQNTSDAGATSIRAWSTLTAQPIA